jgi:hypothetical protein
MGEAYFCAFKPISRHEQPAGKPLVNFCSRIG